ncbi:hypothetical protein H6776_01955 [Candidatus Nomurabacteria bacterium]|nr:hypothetical protein [Candidatus Nomurabacteria bacterium]
MTKEQKFLDELNEAFGISVPFSEEDAKELATFSNARWNTLIAKKTLNDRGDGSFEITPHENLTGAFELAKDMGVFD